MSEVSGTVADNYVLMNVYDQIDPPVFEPRNISTSNGKAVRFFLDYSSGTLRASLTSRIIESAGPENPCTELKGGWNITISPDDWLARYVEMSLGDNYKQRGRFFFGQLKPGETSECLSGLWGAIDVSESELQAYNATVALVKNNGSTSTQTGSNRSTPTTPIIVPTWRGHKEAVETPFQKIMPYVAMAIVTVGLCVISALAYLWLRRRRRRRAAMLDNALPNMSETSISRGDMVHRDENDRIVMRAESVSSLPLYSPVRTSGMLSDITSSPPPNPFNDPPNPFADTTREDDDDDVPLMALIESRLSTSSSVAARQSNDRRRSAAVVSPTRTMHSDLDTLPEYQSIGGPSRPPSFVSRRG